MCMKIKSRWQFVSIFDSISFSSFHSIHPSIYPSLLAMNTILNRLNSFAHSCRPLKTSLNLNLNIPSKEQKLFTIWLPFWDLFLKHISGFFFIFPKWNIDFYSLFFYIFWQPEKVYCKLILIAVRNVANTHTCSNNFLNTFKPFDRGGFSCIFPIFPLSSLTPWRRSCEI